MLQLSGHAEQLQTSGTENVLSCQLCKLHLNTLIIEVDRPLANFVSWWLSFE